MIRILLAEDQAMMRGALAVLLGLEPDLEVVAEVSTGPDVLPRARATRPDVVLLDIELPGRSGLDVAADLARELPACRVVMVTTFARPGYVQRAMAPVPAGSWSRTGQPTSWPRRCARWPPAAPWSTPSSPDARCGTPSPR